MNEDIAIETIQNKVEKKNWKHQEAERQFQVAQFICNWDLRKTELDEAKNQTNNGWNISKFNENIRIQIQESQWTQTQATWKKNSKVHHKHIAQSLREKEH